MGYSKRQYHSNRDAILGTKKTHEGLLDKIDEWMYIEGKVKNTCRSKKK